MKIRSFGSMIIIGFLFLVPEVLSAQTLSLNEAITYRTSADGTVTNIPMSIAAPRPLFHFEGTSY